VYCLTTADSIRHLSNGGSNLGHIHTERGQYTTPLKRRIKPRAHSHRTRTVHDTYQTEDQT
jgi:hypothetical protein